jgi:hypothetical protein
MEIVTRNYFSIIPHFPVVCLCVCVRVCMYYVYTYARMYQVHPITGHECSDVE